MRTVRKSDRPKPPTEPISCPWCSTQPPMAPRHLSQHVHNAHPLEWKGSIYSSLPADFDYGNGPLAPDVRAMLIRYSDYARKAYARNKSKAEKRPYRRKMLPQERGRLGGLARVANARAKLETPSNNSQMPRVDRRVKFCPHCGWNIDACSKAQAFVDGRAE